MNIKRMILRLPNVFDCNSKLSHATLALQLVSQLLLLGSSGLLRAKTGPHHLNQKRKFYLVYLNQLNLVVKSSLFKKTTNSISWNNSKNISKRIGAPKPVSYLCKFLTFNEKMYNSYLAFALDAPQKILSTKNPAMGKKLMSNVQSGQNRSLFSVDNMKWMSK